MKIRVLLMVAFAATLAVGCGRNKDSSTEPYNEDQAADSIITPESEPVVEIPSDSEGLLAWMDASADSAAYASGILPRMAREVPSYCRRLLASPHKRFIVVDKRRMKVIIFDRTGRQEHIYGIACARNYGTKREKGDCRTHEGFFSVRGVYDSTEWLFTDVFGYTSPEKGQFGPRYVCLQTLEGQKLGIGIHGTGSPWTIGGRRSHGCIRVTNENIFDLIQYVDSGMPVIVSPGKLDMISNAQAGLKVPVVYTDNTPTIRLSQSDLQREIPFKPSLPHDYVEPTDSTATAIPAPEEPETTTPVEVADSVAVE